MGAWGVGSFDNDDAMDWFAVLKAEGLLAVGGALQAVPDLAPEYLEAPICSSAIAAAEVVAALRGRPAADLPGEVRDWISRYPGDPGDVLTLFARQAVDLIAEESELAELWQESPDEDAWSSVIADLRERLA